MSTCSMPSPSQLLESFRSSSASSVFVIGHRAPQVTIYSQQVRALQLIWAIHHEIPKGLQDRKVVVIGAGVAGVTAAAAAALFGAKATLLERAEEPLHLQRGCHTRHIHPRIFDWPGGKARHAGAGLPILNWSVGTAHDVATSIWAGFYGIRQLDPSRLELFTSVRDVKLNERTVTWKEKQKDGSLKEQAESDAEMIILAVGFGIEKTVNHLPRRSYWRVDSLTQTALDSEADPYVIVIGGTGDGGIVDVLRAKAKEFDHGGFFDECVLRLDDRGLRDEIGRIEDEAKAEFMRLSSEAAQPDPEDRLSQWLRERYGAVKGLTRVDQVLANRRPDTRVIWTGRLTYPLSLKAQPLIRVLGWRLAELRYVNYIKCSIGSVALLDQTEAKGFRYRVQIDPVDAARKTAQPLEFLLAHQVVVRYGADSALERSFKQVYDAFEKEKVRAPQVGDLQSPIAKAYKDLASARKLCVPRSNRRDDVQLFAFPESEPKKSKTGKQVYRLRIWIVMKPELQKVISWIDYDLHPEYGTVRRRGSRMENPEQGQHFRHWINTWDDFWVRIRCSDGGESGEWLSNAIKATLSRSSNYSDDERRIAQECIDNLRREAASMRKVEPFEYLQREWCDYVDAPE